MRLKKRDREALVDVEIDNLVERADLNDESIDDLYQRLARFEALCRALGSALLVIGLQEEE